MQGRWKIWTGLMKTVNVNAAMALVEKHHSYPQFQRKTCLGKNPNRFKHIVFGIFLKIPHHFGDLESSFCCQIAHLIAPQRIEIATPRKLTYVPKC